MATAAQASPRPLSEVADSVHLGTAAPMATQPSSGSSLQREDANNITTRPHQTSSSSKHAKRHVNQPILVWLQRKIGGKGHSVKKSQTSELSIPNHALGHKATESSDSATLNRDPKETVRASRKPSQLV